MGDEDKSVATRGFVSRMLESIRTMLTGHVNSGSIHVSPDDRRRWDEKSSVKGDPLTWDDLTPAQKESLRGRPLVFSDLTEEEKAELKGDKGDPLTWDDLTPEQKAGLKGDKGDPLTWDDLTPEQIEMLKGKSFTFEDLTDRQKEELRGKPLTWDDLDDAQKASLKGDKGDPLRFDDLSETQKAELKGEKGDPLTFSQLTEEEKAELKGKDGTSAYLKSARVESSSGPVEIFDQSVNYWTASSAQETVVLPAPVSGKSRDFLLVVRVPSGIGTYSITPGGQYTILPTDDDPLDVATFGGGTVVFGFTEVRPGEFLVTHKWARHT